MTTKMRVFALIPIMGLLAMFQAAPAQDDSVDGNDFLVWQREASFSSLEKLEIVFERVERQRRSRPGTLVAFELVVTDAAGDIIGQVVLENSGTSNDRRKVDRPRGFGFVTMSSDGRGVLMIDDSPSGQLTQNPITGRYLLGLALISSRPPKASLRIPGVTITIVDDDGQTKAGTTINSDPGYGIRKPG